MCSKQLILFGSLFVIAQTFAQKPSLMSQQTGNQFQYEDCDCVKLDLEIHNGLYGAYGGQAIADSEETTKGAVTIANLNDTDGDGIIDNIDNSVTGSSSGRSEVDLMKLRITSNGTIPVRCPNLRLDFPSSVKIWESSEKVSPANNVISLSALPLIVWVEVTSVSSSVRDITINASLNEVLEGTGDQVKATAIWAEKKPAYTSNGIRASTPIPSSLGIDNPDFLNFINSYATASDGSLYGFGSYQPISGTSPPIDGFFGGRILFEYELKPNGIESELSNLGIKYDISRRIARNNEWLNYSSTNTVKDVSSFPNQVEEGNDDSECYCPMGPSDMIDEDAIPSANKIFSYDAPSETLLASARAFSIRRLDFEEFARVSFGIDIVGNIQEGSQCSEDHKWNLEYSLVSNATLYGSDPYDASFQYMQPTVGGTTMVSNPRRLIGVGTGAISFGAISSSSILTYLLEFNTTLDQWTLYERTTSGNNPVATSNVSSSGPWNINYTTVNVNISNGMIPFSAGALLSFNIWDVPAVSNSITSN